MWIAVFWKDAAERAVRTFAQTLASLLLVGQTDVLSIDWQAAITAAAVATLGSLLTSVAAARRGDVGTAALVTRPPAGDGWADESEAAA